MCLGSKHWIRLLDYLRVTNIDNYSRKYPLRSSLLLTWKVANCSAGLGLYFQLIAFSRLYSNPPDHPAAVFLEPLHRGLGIRQRGGTPESFSDRRSSGPRAGSCKAPKNSAQTKAEKRQQVTDAGSHAYNLHFSLFHQHHRSASQWGTRQCIVGAQFSCRKVSRAPLGVSGGPERAVAFPRCPVMAKLSTLLSLVVSGSPFVRVFLVLFGFITVFICEHINS